MRCIIVEMNPIIMWSLIVAGISFLLSIYENSGRRFVRRPSFHIVEKSLKYACWVFIFSFGVFAMWKIFMDAYLN
jgi:hypothetical protein